MARLGEVLREALGSSTLATRARLLATEYGKIDGGELAADAVERTGQDAGRSPFSGE